MMSEKQTDPAPPYSPQWDRITRYLVAIALVLFGIWVLTLLNSVLTMLVISFIISFLMYRPALLLHERLRFPWAGGVILLYLAIGLLLTLAIIILVPELSKGLNSFTRTVERAYEDLQTALTEHQPEWGFIEFLGFSLNLNPIIEPLRTLLQPSTAGETDVLEPGLFDPIALPDTLGRIFNTASSITNFLTRVVGGVAGLLTSILLGFLLSLLILLDMPRNRNMLYQMTNPSYHREIAQIVSQLQQTWWAFFRGQVVLALAVAVLTYLQLRIMGITGALLFAILTGFLVFIPAIGGFIALIPQVAVGLLNGSTTFPEMPYVLVALLILAGNVLISQVIWNLLSPKIMGDALKLPTALIICAVFVGAAIGGILGAFLIAPIASSARIVVRYLLHKIGGRDPFPNAPWPGEEQLEEAPA